MNYRNLEIWRMARSLSIDIHQLTLQLPPFEQQEEGRQLRSAIKSVRTGIVQGIGLRRYTRDYLRSLSHTLSHNEKAINHLEMLFETGSLQDVSQYRSLRNRLSVLSIKIQHVLSAVELQEETMINT